MDFNFLVPKQRNDGSERSSLFRRRNYHQNHGPRGDTDLELEPVNQTSPVYADGTPMSPVNKVLLNKRLSDSIQSLSSELGEFTQEDSFQTEVSQKTQMYMIGRQEAETEVCIDRIIKTEGSKDKALLYVTSKLQRESKAQVFVNQLLNRGANPSSVDTHLWTPLHYAVKNNFRSICNRLLESEALPNVRDRDKKMPLFIAIENNNDEIAALLIAYMYNAEVRQLFLCDGSKCAELSFINLICKKLQKTTLAVLDSMIESSFKSRQIRIYYNVLEADSDGRPPDNPSFNQRSQTPLQLIAKIGNKDVVYHDTVRLLVKRKWLSYARFRFQLNCGLYLISLFELTYCAVVAAMTTDPMVYGDGALQIVRAVFEVFFYVTTIITLAIEINQFRKLRMEYFHDKFNWLDASSALFILAVLPLRITHQWQQWLVFALGYLFWTLRIFKYAAVFRQTGAYIQILWRILTNDFIQFMSLFIIILLAFSGSFLLALRGEESLHVHSETSTFWGILFVGLRTLIESDPVLPYTGPDGYQTFSCILMVAFLFMCCVVLLNILIAQLSDTYQNIQQDAQRGVEANRAWIVTRVELNSLYLKKSQRVLKYKPYEDIPDINKVLLRWRMPPLYSIDQSIQDIQDDLKAHRLDQLTVYDRLARQETTLISIQDQLAHIFSRLDSVLPRSVEEQRIPPQQATNNHLSQQATNDHQSDGTSR